MVWWNNKNAQQKRNKGGVSNNRQTINVEAYLYDKPGEVSNLREPRPRRFDQYGRYSYR